MAIDQVHDLQQIYRKLLHSMARPGTISSVQEEAGKAEDVFGGHNAVIVSAMALLDAEVTFHILSENRRDLAEKISEYTSAKYAGVHEADFILVLLEDDEQAILQAMANCKIGTLVDPQQSATWIIESPLLSNDGELLLTGPGIQSAERLHTNMPPSFWKARSSRIKEYPMGIDLIFADGTSQIACLPRTTSVMMEVE